MVLMRRIISAVGVSRFTERRVPSAWAASTSSRSVPGMTFMWM